MNFTTNYFFCENCKIQARIFMGYKTAMTIQPLVLIYDFNQIFMEILLPFLNSIPISSFEITVILSTSPMKSSGENESVITSDFTLFGKMPYNWAKL